MLKLRKQGIHADAHDLAAFPGQGSFGHQRPPTNHGPAVDLGVGLLGAFDFGERILRCFLVVIHFLQLQVGVPCQFFFGAADPLLQIRGGLIASQNGDDARFALQQLGHRAHHEPAGFDVIGPHIAQPFRFGSVRIETHHRHSFGDGIVDGPHHLGRIGAGDRDGVNSRSDKLLDEFSLFLRIFVVGCPPVDLHGDAQFLGERRGPRFGPFASCQEHGVGLAFGDHANRHATPRCGGRFCGAIGRFGRCDFDSLFAARQGQPTDACQCQCAIDQCVIELSS